MARFLTALALALPLTVACLDGQLHSSAEDGTRATGLPSVDPIANAQRALPGARLVVDPRSALDVDRGRPVGPPSITLDDGWLRQGGGDIDEQAGAQRWARTVGAAGWDSIQQVVRYSASEVLVVGWIEGEVDFGGACGKVVPGMRTATEPFLYASYVARFNDSGVCAWIDRFDSDDAWPTAVAVDAAHNFYVVGMFTTEVRFGPGVDLAASGSTYDAFIARYSGSGLDWTRSITGASDTWVSDAAVIEDGNGADLVVAGSFDGTAELDATTSLTAAGGYDMLVARYSSTGALAFATALGAEGLDQAYAVSASGGDVVVAGGFDSATLPIGGLAPLTNAGSFDGALIKLSGTGAPLWAEGFGSAGEDWIADVAMAGSDVAVVGSFAGTMSPAGLPAMTASGTSMFVARLSGAGGGVWSHVVSSASGYAHASSVRANAGGDLYVAAVVNGDAAFGSTTISPAAGSWSIVTACYDAAGAETPTWASKRDRSGTITLPVLDLSDRYVVVSADVSDNGGDMAFYGLGL